MSRGDLWIDYPLSTFVNADQLSVFVDFKILGSKTREGFAGRRVHGEVDGHIAGTPMGGIDGGNS